MYLWPFVLYARNCSLNFSFHEPSFIHTKLALPQSHHNVKWRLWRLHYDVKMQLQGIFITIYGHHIYNIKSWWKVFQCFSGDEIIMSSWWHNEVSTNLHRPNHNVHCNGKYMETVIKTIKTKVGKNYQNFSKL